MAIKIEDGIDDLTAIILVKQVIERGIISGNGNSYCYLTLFGDIFVETRQYRKSPCFRVYKKWVMTVQELVDALNKVEDKSKINKKTDEIKYGLDFRFYNV